MDFPTKSSPAMPKAASISLARGITQVRWADDGTRLGCEASSGTIRRVWKPAFAQSLWLCWQQSIAACRSRRALLASAVLLPSARKCTEQLCSQVQNNSVNSSPAVAALKTFAAGMAADTIKAAASPLTMSRRREPAWEEADAAQARRHWRWVAIS